MAEQNLALNFRSLYPRLLSFGIGYGDLERITSRVNDWTSFSRAMADLGEHWEASGTNHTSQVPWKLPGSSGCAPPLTITTHSCGSMIRC